MENHLNSVLLEGVLEKDPKFEIKDGVPFCSFTIGSFGTKNKYEGSGYEYSYFDIETYDQQAEICHEHLKEGYTVRIVGKAKQGKFQASEGKGKLSCRVYFIADHIEIKPELKKEG